MCLRSALCLSFVSRSRTVSSRVVSCRVVLLFLLVVPNRGIQYIYIYYIYLHTSSPTWQRKPPTIQKATAIQQPTRLHRPSHRRHPRMDLRSRRVRRRRDDDDLRVAPRIGSRPRIQLQEIEGSDPLLLQDPRAEFEEAVGHAVEESEEGEASGDAFEVGE